MTEEKITKPDGPQDEQPGPDAEAVVEDLERGLAFERKEREKAGRLLRLERSSVFFVIFMILVAVVGLMYFFEVSLKAAAIIGGVGAIVMMVGLLMTPRDGIEKDDKFNSTG